MLILYKNLNKILLFLGETVFFDHYCKYMKSELTHQINEIFSRIISLFILKGLYENDHNLECSIEMYFKM